MSPLERERMLAWNEAISAASDVLARLVRESGRILVRDALERAYRDVRALKR